MTAQPMESAATPVAAPAHGAEITVPLNTLKASPRNARKVKHSAAAIEALAGSIKAKGALQPPVVEIERDGEGAPTGNYLVTIGEGRRQSLRLLAKRKAIKRTHPVRCIVDAENDAHEISLDENITARRCIRPTSSRPSGGSRMKRATVPRRSALGSGCRPMWCASGCGWGRRRPS